MDALLAAALDLIAAGNGHLSPLVNSSANGQSFSREIILSALDVADICQSALDEAAGVASAGDDGSPIFTHLNHGMQFIQT